MSDFSALTSTQLKRAADLKDKIEALNRQLEAILGASSPLASKPGKRGGMSAAGRAKVAAAQKARWARVNAAKSANAAKPAAKKKFTMSAAAKAKISAAAKARWAKIRAAKKA